MQILNRKNTFCINYTRIERLTGGAALGESSKSAGRKMRIGPPQMEDSEDDYRQRPSPTTERNTKKPQGVTAALGMLINEHA